MLKKTPGPFFLLFLTFLILKLTGVIDWSWWYITMPLWIFWAILLAIGLTFGLVVGTVGSMVGIIRIIEKRIDR